MGKVQELYDRIVSLENELTSFSEKSATDEIRHRVYPKIAKLSNLYYKLAPLIEARYPKVSLYCYWRAFRLTAHPFVCRYFFKQIPPAKTTEPDTNETVHFNLDKTTPDENRCLAALQFILGVGVEKDSERGLNLLTSEKNNAYALYLLGVLDYYNHPSRSNDYYQLAANQGYDQAQNDLGYWHMQRREDDTAIYLFRLALTQGYICTLYNMGVFYESGRGGLPKSEETASAYFILSAEHGLAKAQYKVGEMYLSGSGGLTRSHENAVKYYTMSAKQEYEDAIKALKQMANDGNACAQGAVGRMYELGRIGFPQSDEKAFEYYNLAYINGFRIVAPPGKMYGQSVKRMADKGSVDALLLLEQFYEIGWGSFQKSEENAIRCVQLVVTSENTRPEQYNSLEKFADKRYFAAAQYTLGQMYELEGKWPLAVEYYTKAARQGNTLASFHLGRLYETGKPGAIPKDDKQAFYYYQVTVGFNHPVPLNNSGDFYRYLQDNNHQEEVLLFLDRLMIAIRPTESPLTVIDFTQFLWTDDGKEVRPQFKFFVEKYPFFLDQAPIPYVIANCDQMMTRPAMKVKRTAAMRKFFDFSRMPSIRDKLTKETLIGLLTLAKKVETIRELSEDSNLMALLDDSDKAIIYNANPMVQQYFDSTQQTPSPETIYKALRKTESEIHISVFGRHIPPTLLLGFIKNDSTISSEEKIKCFSKLLPILFSQKPLVITYPLVDILIDLFKEMPSYLIQYLQIGGEKGRRLFLERVQEKKSEDQFEKTEAGVIWEAFAYLHAGKMKYSCLLKGLLAARNQSAPDSIHQFLNDLLEESPDDPKPLFKYEKRTLEGLSSSWPNIPPEDQAVCVNKIESFLAYFSKRGAGILLQIEIFFIHLKIASSERLLLKSLETLANLFHSFEEILAKTPPSEWRDTILSEIKDKVVGLTQVQLNSEKCRDYIEKHAHSWRETLERLQPSARKPMSYFWEDHKSFVDQFKLSAGSQAPVDTSELDKIYPL